MPNFQDPSLLDSWNGTFRKHGGTSSTSMGYIPMQGTKARLILECKAIKQSRINKKESVKNNSKRNKNNPSLARPEEPPKDMRGAVAFFARTAVVTAPTSQLIVFLKNKYLPHKASQPRNCKGKEARPPLFWSQF